MKSQPHRYYCHLLHLFSAALALKYFPVVMRKAEQTLSWLSAVFSVYPGLCPECMREKMWEKSGSLRRCQVLLWTIAVVLVFKRFLLWDSPVWVSISLNIPLSWQLMLERTEQLLTEAQWAFLWQWSLSWTVSPLSAAPLSPPPRTQQTPPPPPPTHPPTHTHTHTRITQNPHLLHLSQEGSTVISVLG